MMEVIPLMLAEDMIFTNSTLRSSDPVAGKHGKGESRRANTYTGGVARRQSIIGGNRQDQAPEQVQGGHVE